MILKGLNKVNYEYATCKSHTNVVFLKKHVFEEWLFFLVKRISLSGEYISLKILFPEEKKSLNLTPIVNPC